MQQSARSLHLVSLSSDLWLTIPIATMHHAMPDGYEVRDCDFPLPPDDERIDRVLVRRGLDRPTLAGPHDHVREGQCPS